MLHRFDMLLLHNSVIKFQRDVHQDCNVNRPGKENDCRAFEAETISREHQGVSIDKFVALYLKRDEGFPLHF